MAESGSRGDGGGLRVDGRSTVLDRFRAERAVDLAIGAGVQDVRCERSAPDDHLTQLFQVQGFNMQCLFWSSASEQSERAVSPLCSCTYSVQLHLAAPTVRVDRVGAGDLLEEAGSVEVPVESVSRASPCASQAIRPYDGAAHTHRVDCVFAPQCQRPDEISHRAYHLQVFLEEGLAATEGAFGSIVNVGYFRTQVCRDARFAKRVTDRRASDRWLVHDFEANLRRAILQVSFSKRGPQPTTTQGMAGSMDRGASDMTVLSPARDTPCIRSCRPAR